MPTQFRLVGVLHLPPLPGAVNYGGTPVREIARRAAEDAVALQRAGFTHVMVQDASDMPQAVRVSAPTVAALSVIGAAVTNSVYLPVGVVVGHNDGPSAVAIAHAIGAQFVRVKVLTGVSVGPTGWIEGCAHDVAAVKRLLGADVEVWADVHEATSLALASTPEWAAREARDFGRADVLVVTRDSGVPDALTTIATLRRTVPGVPFVVGGRVSLDTVDAAVAGSDGAILGSAIKRSSAPDARVDPDVAARFGAALRAGAALSTPDVHRTRTPEPPVTRTSTPASPFLGPGSPLDARQQEVVQRVSDAEHASIVALPSDHPLDPKRRARDEATHPELLAQPDRIRETLAVNDAALDELADLVAATDLDRVFVTGAGDSLAVAIAARQVLEAMLGVPCEPAQSLDLAYYLAPLVTERTLVIALSSSGETTRTVEAALVAQHAGALTVAVTNTPGSTLAAECRRTLLLRATRVGWPTQSSTTALALLVDLAVRVGRRTGRPGAAELAAELARLPDLMERVLREVEAPLAAIAEREQGSGPFLFSAAGPTWGSAVIGAAKVKECTPDHARRSRSRSSTTTTPSRPANRSGSSPRPGPPSPAPCTPRARPSASAAGSTR